jgi:hypothetical protein
LDGKSGRFHSRSSTDRERELVEDFFDVSEVIFASFFVSVLI